MRTQRAGNGESRSNGKARGSRKHPSLDDIDALASMNVPILPNDGESPNPGKNGKSKNGKPTTVLIKPPDIRTIIIPIFGTAPLVVHRFANKAELEEKHAKGGSSRGKRKLEPKDFKGLYEKAKHVSEEGWCGIPAAAFRAAMISACRLVGFQMSRAKLSIFVVGDGIEREDGTDLVRIYGEPRMITSPVRNSTGVIDIRARPQWVKWSCKPTIQYDADQFTEQDVVNLLLRAGIQVGLCEGRPDSKNSAGMGWGRFTIDETQGNRDPKKTRKSARNTSPN